MEVSPQVASSLLDQYLEERLLQKAVDARRPETDGEDRRPSGGGRSSRGSPGLDVDHRRRPEGRVRAAAGALAATRRS